MRAERAAGEAERTVLVDFERLPRWLADFADRHGAPVAARGPDAGSVVLTAPDRTRATCLLDLDPPSPEMDPAAPWGGLLDRVAGIRRIGVLLVRRGGYAAGVFDGPRLATSKVGSRYVQGRTAAGGQSQQRFARRRANQADALVGAAAEVAARILLPAAAELDALHLGGDRALVGQVLADRRLAALAGRPRGRFLAVGEPRLAELTRAGRSARSVRIRIADPPPPDEAPSDRPGEPAPA